MSPQKEVDKPLAFDLIGQALLPSLTEDEINEVSGGMWVSTKETYYSDFSFHSFAVDSVFLN